MRTDFVEQVGCCKDEIVQLNQKAGKIKKGIFPPKHQAWPAVRYDLWSWFRWGNPQGYVLEQILLTWRPIGLSNYL